MCEVKIVLGGRRLGGGPCQKSSFGFDAECGLLKNLFANWDTALNGVKC